MGNLITEILMIVLISGLAAANWHLLKSLSWLEDQVILLSRAVIDQRDALRRQEKRIDDIAEEPWLKSGE